jgi:hypothetical protein
MQWEGVEEGRGAGTAALNDGLYHERSKSRETEYFRPKARP